MNWLKLIAYIVLTIVVSLILGFLSTLGIVALGGSGIASMGIVMMLIFLILIGMGAGVIYIMEFPILLVVNMLAGWTVAQGIFGAMVLLIAIVIRVVLNVISWRCINKNKKIGYGGSGFMKFASIIVPGIGLPIFLEGRGWY